MSRHIPPSFGVTIYPTASAHRSSGHIGVTPFLRCIQCGLPNDTRRTSWSNAGEGIGAAFGVTVTAVTGQTQAQANTKDRNVQSGCRFCGSLKWRNSRPQPLPDDRYKPSSEWYDRKGRR